MLSQLVTFADIALVMRRMVPFLLFLVSPSLVIAGIWVYQEKRSYQRQEKPWVWYKQTSAISFIGPLSWLIASALIYGTGVSKVIPDNPFTATLIWAFLLAGIALPIYNIILSSQRTKR